MIEKIVNNFNKYEKYYEKKKKKKVEFGTLLKIIYSL